VGFIRWKYATLADPRARAAIAEYADGVYGRAWRMPEIVHVQPRAARARGWWRSPEVEEPCPGRRPEHVRLLRHIDWLNPTVRRIA
jgi:hypothetical protein